MPTTMRTEADRNRNRGQADAILQLLREAGESGCLNVELWNCAHAANSRIADLRARGHRIICTRELVGVYRYTLVEDPLPKPDVAPQSVPPTSSPKPDWFTEATGKPRPETQSSLTHDPEPGQVKLPLFAGLDAAL